MQDKSKKVAGGIALIYGLVGGVWILVSDQAVDHWLPDMQGIAHFQTYKGLGFIAVTAGLLFLTVRFFLKQREQERVGREAVEVTLAGQQRVLEMIAKDAPLKKTLETLLELTEAQSPDKLSSILLLDEQGFLRHGAAPSLPKAYCQAVDGIKIGPKVGSCGTAAFRRETVVVEDIMTSPLWEEWRGMAQQHDLRACWSTPIFDEQQGVLGTFAVYSRKPGRPSRSLEELIASVTHLAAIAIERQRFHAALIKSEERYRNLTDSAADSFFVHDERGVLIEVNRRACESLGYSREEMTGMNLTDVEQEFDQRALEKVLRQLKPGQARTMVGTHRRKNGSEFPVEVRLGSFESGGRQLYHSLARDITDRKRAADALEMFRTLVDRVNDAIEVVDPETGRFLDINEKACADLGYAREELLSLNYTDIDPQTDLAGFKKNKERLWDSGALMLESLHRRKDGSTFPVEVSMKWVWLDRDYIVAVVRDISDRKHAEAAVQESEERLRHATHAGEIGIFDHDHRTGTIYWSPEQRRIYGWSDDETVTLDKYFEHVHPDDRNRIVEAVRRAHDPAGDGSFDTEHRIVDRGGRLHWLNTRSRTYFAGEDNARQKVRTIGAVADITERKKAEEALRASEHQYAGLVNNIDGIVWEANPTEGRMTFVSYQVERILGYPLEQWLSSTHFWEKHIHPEDHAKVVANSRDHVQRGEGHNFEYRMIAADGRVVWIHDFVSVVAEPGQPAILRGVMVDVTARKRAEAELRKREEHFRLLIENASDLISVIDNQGVLQFQSPSAGRMLGYRPEEMIGHGVFEYLHPEDAPRIGPAIQRAVANPGLPVSVEYRFRHQDGSWRYFQSVGRSIPDEAETGFIIVNSRDITETRKLEEQFRQSQKMEAIGQLAGGVAHDLNNILTVVHMQLDLLKYGEPLNPVQLESVVDIEKASRRAADLTRQLLMFSRRQAALKGDLDLNAVVTNITKMLQRIVGEDVGMHISYAPQPLPVHADSGMLDQVLLNLAVNSRDAMPDGGRLIIETSVVTLDETSVAQRPLARVGKFACLTVSDTGKGIPPEVLPRIYEPFFTTKDIGKGTGLGLATVFGIVQQHNGWINVQSELNKGTTFQIYLPLQNATPDGSDTTELDSDFRGGNETILLVEDEQSLRVLVRNVLTRLGYRVLEATTGVTALEVWKEHQQDIRLLLTDLVMPDGMTGKALAEQLIAQNAKLKVIYTSGYSREIAGKDFPLQDGVNFLSKPFQAAKLAQTVRSNLDGV